MPRPLLLAVILTLTYLIGLAIDIAPWLRGPDEWRWAYAVPATIARLWPQALLLVIYSLVAHRLQERPLTRRVKTTALALSALMTVGLQCAALYMDHPDVRVPLFYRTVSESAGGYFNVGATAAAPVDFLAHFSEHMASYPVHPQRHPPGLPLLFIWARQFFDQHQGLTQSINAVLRPYQCQNLPLMKLSDGAIASATLQMIVPLLLGLVVWPLCRLGRELYDDDTALRAVLVWPLIPSIVLWATRWDHVYALFTVSCLLLLHLGLTRRKAAFLFLAGVIFSLATFFSFGNVVIAGLSGIYAALWLTAHTDRLTFRWLAMGAAVFVTGSSLLWIVLYMGTGLNLFAVWRIAISLHLGLDRSYRTWVFFQLYDFFVFMGIPICVWWAARTVSAIREARSRSKPIDPLALAFVIGLILLDVSNTSRGEVARVWSFLLPLPLLIAVHRMPKRSSTFTSLVVLLSLQVFVSSMFLRPVTSLPDPPEAPASVNTTPPTAIATWRHGISLRSITVPQSAAPGQQIAVGAIWTTAQPINYPYSIFVHVLDDQGKIVAQYDGMPLDNRWPLTCWRVGQTFQDRYTLTLPAQSSDTTYQIRLGLYSAETGDRLPIDGQDETVDRGLPMGSFQVKAD